MKSGRIWLAAALLAGTAAGQGTGGWEVDYGAVSQVGQWIWDQVAPEGVRGEWEVMDGEQLKQLAGALEGGGLGDLAALAPMAREALGALRGVAGMEWAADWLGARLDYFEMAAECERVLPSPGGGSGAAAPAVEKARGRYAQSAEAWAKKLRGRAVPKGATSWLGTVKRIFREEGVPEALAWQAEAESSFNPAARSPAGAVGLFQFMKGTAREYGLKTEPKDERLDAEKSARAAAKYLAALDRRFGDWELALAAYNAGPTKISRLLKETGGKTFGEIAERLPAETRMYVPKIDGLLREREGTTLGALPHRTQP